MDTKLYEQLARDEGKSLFAYRDSKGRWTIGIGHLIDMDSTIESPRILRITEEECQAFFEHDVLIVGYSLRHVFTWDVLRNVLLDGPRWRALINMSFNRGEQNMKKSTTITPAIKAVLTGTGTWEAVSDAIKASPWGAEIKDRGIRLAKQFETGVDQ